MVISEYNKSERDVIRCLIPGCPYPTETKESLIECINRSCAGGFGAIHAPLVKGLMDYFGLTLDDADDVYHALWDKYLVER